jgi:hypothetical protein
MKNYKIFIKENNSLINDGYGGNNHDKQVIDDIFDDIEKKCKEYLNMLKIDGKILWRGMYIDKDIDIIIPRKDRKPKDSPEIIQNILDDLFEEKFGIRPRSQGTFAYQTQSKYNQYGTEYMIFPVDGFKYVWSYDVVDFYVLLRDIIGYSGIDFLKTYKNYDNNILKNYYNKNQTKIYNVDDIFNVDDWLRIMSMENIKEKLKKIVEEYQDTDLDYLLKKGTDDKEVCIVCDEYFAISEEYKYLVFDKIKEYITTKK